MSFSEYCSTFNRSALRKRGRVGGGLVKRMQGKEICFDNNIIKRNAVLALRDVPKNTFAKFRICHLEKGTNIARLETD